MDVDERGFVTILGRAKRFAKIGGEMVSMPAAEALATAVWPGASHAVLAVPDPRKGEALVLLTTQAGADARELVREARARGVPELQVPRVVHVVRSVPVLGSGKTDYPAAQRLLDGLGRGWRSRRRWGSDGAGQCKAPRRRVDLRPPSGPGMG